MKGQEASLAWAGSKDPRAGTRKSWFMQDEEPADMPTPEWRKSPYDIMQHGTATEFQKMADEHMIPVDSRTLFSPNTHPEYKRWLERMTQAMDTLKAQEAVMASAMDVTYDMEGRAFGVPIAKPGTMLRKYNEFESSGGRVAPEHAKSFYYLVDADGKPTNGNMDGWNPQGEAAALDEFARRAGTGSSSVPAQFADPSTWRPRVAEREPDAADALLATESANIVAHMTATSDTSANAHAREDGYSHIRSDFVGARLSPPPSTKTDAPIRLSTGTSTRNVARPPTLAQGSTCELTAASLRQAEEDATTREARVYRGDAFVAYGDVEEQRAVDASASGTALGLAACAPARSSRRRLPLRAIVPCITNSVKGVAYDLAHWNELPTAGDGVLPTLKFVATRDGRGSFLLMLILAILFVALLIATGIAMCTRASALRDAYMMTAMRAAMPYTTNHASYPTAPSVHVPAM